MGVQDVKNKVIDFLRNCELTEKEIVKTEGHILSELEKFENIKAVPSFLQEHLSYTIAKCQEVEKDMGRGGAFIFTTDNHLHENTMYDIPLIRAIAEKTTLNKTFCGGDFPWAFGTRGEGLADLFLSLELLKEIEPRTRLYVARGNHDFTIRTSWEDDSGYTLPYAKVSALFATYQSKGIQRPEGTTYFYVDDEKEKIRYIVLDTCSKKIKGEFQSWSTICGIDEEQMQWLVDEALQIEDGKDWSVVAIGHIPCLREQSDTGHALDSLAEVFQDFKNKRKGRYKDFSNVKAEFVAYIAGHNHKDLGQVVDNTLFISSGSSSRLYDDCWDREAGTVNEVLFDIFFVDKEKKTLKTIRVGAGKDREFQYDGR